MILYYIIFYFLLLSHDADSLEQISFIILFMGIEL